MTSQRGAAGLVLALVGTPAIATLVVVMVLDGGSVDAWLEMVAWVSVATILATLWVLRSYLRYRATDAEARRHLRELRPQLLAGTSVRVRIRQGFDAIDARERLRDGFAREDSLEESDATIRDVGGGLASAAASARPSWVPVLAWRGILEGLLLLVVGLVAFAPIAWWRSAVEPTTPRLDDVAVLLDLVLSLSMAALAAFPHAETVQSIALASGILAISSIWGAWIVPALILVIGGLLLSWLHRRIWVWDEAPDGEVGASAPRVGLRLLAWGAILWVVGVGVALPFRAIDGLVDASIGPVGEVIALLAVALVALAGAYKWLLASIRRINDIASLHLADTTVVVSYLVVRRIYLALSIVASLLLVGYVGTAIVSGRLLEVVGVIAAAPTWVLAILGLGILALLVIAALQIPAVLEDLRDLSSRITRSTALRLWLFARGIPIVGTVSAFAIVLAMFAALTPAVVAAVVTGVVLRVVGSVVVRAKYAALRRYSGISRPVKEVHVSTFTVEDADGEELYVADVDGLRLIHRDRDELVDDVLEVVRERTESGESVSTESEHYAERVDMGFIDLERLRTKLRAETRLETRVFVRDAGGEIEEESARETLTRDYPKPVVDEEISELRRRGILDRRSGRLVLRESSGRLRS